MTQEVLVTAKKRRKRWKDFRRCLIRAVLWLFRGCTRQFWGPHSKFSQQPLDDLVDPSKRGAARLFAA